MSESASEDIEVSASVVAKAEFEDDEDALEALVQVKDLDFETIFPDRDTRLGDEEEEGVSILFNNDETNDHLLIRTSEESTIRIHLNLSNDGITHGAELFGQLLKYITPIVVERVMVYRTFDIPFSALDLPVDPEFDIDVAGMRFVIDDRDYIVQEMDNGELSLNLLHEIDEGFSDEFPQEILTRDVDEAERFVMEELR